MTEARKVAVTGAGGFVGRALMAALEQAPDLEGLSLSRRDGGPELETASEDEWKRALAGARSCVHLASMLPHRPDNAKREALPRFLEINAEASARILRAFRAAGGRHFIFLSTININGIVSADAPFRETDPPRPAGNYGISKLRAEEELAAIAREGGVTLTILRCPIIYGAGVAYKFGDLVAAVRRRRLLPLGGIDNHRDMIGVRNLADLLVQLLREETAGTYLVRDRDPVSTTALVEMIAEAYGVAPNLVAIPRWARSAAARLPVAGPLAARLFGDVRIDDAALEQASGWRPRHRVADEIGDMARRDAR